MSKQVCYDAMRFSRGGGFVARDMIPHGVRSPVRTVYRTIDSDITNGELVFWTTCGPADTFDPRITGVAGTWYFDDGTTIYAASWAEIRKTFAAEGLHRAVYRPTSGGLAAITEIDANTDLLTSVWGIEKISALLFLSLSINAGLVISLASIPPTTTLYARDCKYISGPLSQLKDGCQTVYLYRSPSVLPGSISHLTTIRDLGVYTLGWLTADVDTVLLSIANAIVANAAHFTYATPEINIGGTNEAPSGTYQAPTGPGGTPTSGLEAVWVMVHNTGHAWTVTFTGGVANVLLLGNVAGTGEKTWSDVGALNTRTYAQRFVANKGALSDLKIKVGGATNMKMAVYTDVAGNPGTLLAVSDEFSAVGGWNNVTLNTVCDLVTGSYYWIAFKPSVSSIVYYNATGGAMVYKDTAYADAFTADFGAHSDTTADLAVGGYGLKVV